MGAAIRLRCPCRDALLRQIPGVRVFNENANHLNAVLPADVKPTVVLMNPPFSRQQDVQHVLHAFKFLRPGGRLVAVMSPSWAFRQNKLSEEFRQFVDKYGDYYDNPPGTFKAAGTSVNTVLVLLDR